MARPSWSCCAWPGPPRSCATRGPAGAPWRSRVEHALRTGEDGVELKCRPEREAEIFASYPRRLWRTLAQVATPTLVLHGADSYPFVGKGVARWCALSHRISAQVVSGGHCFMQERPDDCAARVRAFLLEAGADA